MWKICHGELWNLVNWLVEFGKKFPRNTVFPTIGLGEHQNLPQRRLGPKPSRKCTLLNFWLRKPFW